MTFDEFLERYLGKAIDYDGAAGVQCVDFVKLYMRRVLGVEPRAIGDAHAYYDDYARYAFLKNNFIRIANDPEFIPRRGDVCVWKKELNGGRGHIAVASGEGTARHFYSYEQNWGGKAAKKVKHNYRYFAGALRPRDDSAIFPQSSTRPAAPEYYPKCGEGFKSITDALKSVGADGGYANRRRIAKANGVGGYRGTPSQNLKLLSLLKRGELLKYNS